MNPWWLRSPTDEPETKGSSESADPEPGSESSAADPQPRDTPPNGRKSRRGGNGNHRRRAQNKSDVRPRSAAAETAEPTTSRRRGGRRIGVLCDVEDTALALRETDSKKFSIHWVVERLLAEGALIVRRAYADWGRFKDQKRSYHEAGFELIDIPRKYHSGKSGTDIKLAVDAMEIGFSKQNVDCIALISGDPDLRPLVAKLRENGIYVIGLGVEGSASRILIECCDEYLFSKKLEPAKTASAEAENLTPERREAFAIVIEAIRSLMEEDRDRIWGSMIKQTIQRSEPSFSEGAYGYSAFSDLLEDAESCDIIRLERDERSGGYVVTDLRDS